MSLKKIRLKLKAYDISLLHTSLFMAYNQKPDTTYQNQLEKLVLYSLFKRINTKLATAAKGYEGLIHIINIEPIEGFVIVANCEGIEALKSEILRQAPGTLNSIRYEKQ